MLYYLIVVHEAFSSLLSPALGFDFESLDLPSH